MKRNQPKQSKSGCMRPILAGILLLAGVYVFRAEVGLLRNEAGRIAGLLLKGTLRGLLPSPDTLQALMTVAAGLGLPILLYFIIILVISQVIFPIRTPGFNWQAFRYLAAAGRGRTRPVARLQLGQVVSRPSLSPAAALLDASSAAVLERRGGVRVIGPGVSFTRPGEKIHGAASLRKQVRSISGVRAYTQDGIEVQADLFVIFTLGEPPDVVQVTYAPGCPPDHGEQPGDLRVVALDEKTQQVTAILSSDALEPQDREEIHAAVQQHPVRGGGQPLGREHDERRSPPFHFDPDRVFAAILSQAQNVSASRVDDWTDLPARVATQTFRDLVSQASFDSLFPLEPHDQPPLHTSFAPRFTQRVRSLGVLSYQFVRPRHAPCVEVGQHLELSEFRIYPVQELLGSKVLRDRGIKIVDAGISEIKPAAAPVQIARLRQIRLRSKKDGGEHNEEVLRIRNRSRLHAQREMVLSLSSILRSRMQSQDAVALRLFETLERAATDPATRQFLPPETFNRLRSLHYWAMPPRAAGEEPGPPPGQAPGGGQPK